METEEAATRDVVSEKHLCQSLFFINLPEAFSFIEKETLSRF